MLWYAVLRSIVLRCVVVVLVCVATGAEAECIQLRAELSCDVRLEKVVVSLLGPTGGVLVTRFSLALSC